MAFKDSKLMWGPEHVNSNVICAIDVRVGGTDPSCSDLLEVCLIPVNHSFKMSKEFNLFSLKIRPSWRVDRKVARLNADNIGEYETSIHDAIGSFGLFEHWCEHTLQLKHNKRIMPLCWDWSLIRPFLKTWMGEEGFATNVDETGLRELVTTMNFVNDRHSFWGDEVPYPIIKEGQMCARSGVALIDKNSMTSNCKAYIDWYGSQLRSYLPVGTKAQEPPPRETTDGS